jgi:glutathione S-transferase
MAHLQKLEVALKGPFLLGDEFTLADVHVFPFVRQLAKVEGVDFIPPLVQTWLEKIMIRPSFARVMNRRL